MWLQRKGNKIDSEIDEISYVSPFYALAILRHNFKFPYLQK